MKYLKKYKNITEFELGDYIAINSTTTSSSKDVIRVNEFISNHVGLIVDYDYPLLIVKYDHNEIPKDIIGFFRTWFIKNKLEFSYIRKVDPEDVIFKSKNKKEVKIFLKSKEYNI